MTSRISRQSSHPLILAPSHPLQPQECANDALATAEVCVPIHTHHVLTYSHTHTPQAPPIYLSIASQDAFYQISDARAIDLLARVIESNTSNRVVSLRQELTNIYPALDDLSAEQQLFATYLVLLTIKGSDACGPSRVSPVIRS